MRGDVALVTGGNSGIGFECARSLARAGWHVVIASRDRAASAAAVARIARESGADAASELGLDLGSFASVRRSRAEIEARKLPLRALVCNAGLQGHEPPADRGGYELTFARQSPRPLPAREPAARAAARGGQRADRRRRLGRARPGDEDRHAEGRDRRSRDARGDGRSDAGPLRRTPRVREQQALQPLVRVRAGAADRRGRLTSGARPLTVNAFDPGLVPGSGLARDYPAALRFVWDRCCPGVARALTPLVPTINPARKAGRRSRAWSPTRRWRPSRGSTSRRTRAGARRPRRTRPTTQRARARCWEESVRMTRLAPGESPLLPRSALARGGRFVVQPGGRFFDRTEDAKLPAGSQDGRPWYIPRQPETRGPRARTRRRACDPPGRRCA